MFTVITEKITDIRVCWNVFYLILFKRTTEIFYEYSFGCDTTIYVFHSEGEFQDCLLKSST